MASRGSAVDVIRLAQSRCRAVAWVVVAVAVAMMVRRLRAMVTSVVAVVVAVPTTTFRSDG
jgi:hypothetical protein